MLKAKSTVGDGMFTKVVDETVIRQYEAMVYRIAREYKTRFKAVERDDIVQEMWMWFVTHPAKVREWMLMPLRDGDRMFARSLRNAAMTFCVKEKARIEGYRVDDLFWYSKDFIKELLPAVLSENWKRVQNSFEHGSRSTKAPGESGDWMSYAADVRRAYDALDDEDRKLVDLFYVHDVHGSVLLEATGRPTIRAAEMAANRAVGKMVKFLGGERPRFKPEDDYVQSKEENSKEEEEND